jgi:hypothetical protein
MPKADKPSALATIDFLMLRLAESDKVIGEEIGKIERDLGAAQRGDHHTSEAVNHRHLHALKRARQLISELSYSVSQMKLRDQVNI